MADNIESWSRTRRASAHSITMSSDEEAQTESIGPSSFTENLTMYIQGGREYIRPQIEHFKQETIEGKHDGLAKNVPITEDVQTLQEELAATLQRHEELMSENEKLRSSLAEALSNNDAKSKPDSFDPDSVAQNALEYSICAHCKVRDVEEGGDPWHSPKDRQELSLQAHTELTHPKTDILRISDLEKKVREQADLLQAAVEREADAKSTAQDLRKELEDRGFEDDQELDRQSLAEELEDELERTRQELFRVVKAKERVERQLTFSQADLSYERTRNEELEEQILKVRKASLINEDLRLNSAGIDHSNTATEIQKLKDALSSTSLRVKSLESKASGRFVSNPDLDLVTDKNVSMNPEREAAPTDRINDPEMGGVETPSSKVMSKYRDLEAAAKAAREETRGMKAQLMEVQKSRHSCVSHIERLEKEVTRLEEIKDRMGRVLMYQWGKEEVGEVQRDKGGGWKEFGMGYRYKYFNKDGSLKPALD